MFRFDVKTETATEIGNAALTAPGGSSDAYVTTIDADPTGKYLYYCAGNAHGSSHKDGAPVVQYNVNTGKKKVIAFLHPYFDEQYKFAPGGTFGSVLSPEGDTLYITWMGDLSRKVENFCAMTVIHIPESERR